MSGLILDTHRIGATDPRDKPYALIHLAAETQQLSPLPLLLQPDYLKPPLQAHFGHPVGCDQISPIPAPAVSSRKHVMDSCFDFKRTVTMHLVAKGYDATKRTTARVSETPDWQLLSLKGMAIYAVDRLIPEDLNGSATLSVRRTDSCDGLGLCLSNEAGVLHKLWMNAARHLGRYPSGEELLSAFLATRHAGQSLIDAATKARVSTSTLPPTGQRVIPTSSIFQLNIVSRYPSWPNLGIAAFSVKNSASPAKDVASW